MLRPVPPRPSSPFRLHNAVPSPQVLALQKELQALDKQACCGVARTLAIVRA